MNSTEGGTKVGVNGVVEHSIEAGLMGATEDAAGVIEGATKGGMMGTSEHSTEAGTTGKTEGAGAMEGTTRVGVMGALEHSTEAGATGTIEVAATTALMAMSLLCCCGMRTRCSPPACARCSISKRK